jgi:hypothetical protein
MKRLLFILMFAASNATAAEPAPKLVPRPIPGMPAAKPVETPTDVLMSAFTPAPAARNPAPPPSAAPVSQAPAAAPADNEPARILFVHRRDRLPAAMRQRLKALPAEPAPVPARPAAAQEMLQERPSAIRIIPKSEVPLLKPPAPPSQP